MRTKSLIAALLLIVASLQTTLGQGFRVYKSDGTFTQFSFRTDSIVFYEGAGEDVDFGPFTPVNQCIVGTWYKSKSETVTFNEDGTTDYIEGATYEFLPYQGIVIFYNASGAPTNILKVYKVTKERMFVSSPDGSNIDTWNHMSQIQLVMSIVLSETSLTLHPDEIKTLTATVLPEDADNKTLTWESSNEEVAEVNRNGRIIANGEGTCTITCYATDGSDVYAECAVSVTNVQLVTSITLNKTSLSLSLPSNTTQTLEATVLPIDATNQSITWSSNDTGVATVDQEGKVKAVAAGSCTITATAEDDSGITAECIVTVNQQITSITLNETSLSLSLPTNNTQRLIATIMPSNATNKELTWSSDNTSIATVDQDGTVTAVARGTCTITCRATLRWSIKATCSVTVGNDPRGYVNGHEWVDLGLPSGTRWATCNIGASSPTGYGDYYAWGETSTKSKYAWSTYQYYKSSTQTCTNIGMDISGTSYDVAKRLWGGEWCMPTQAQASELLIYANWEWTTMSGVKGYKVTGNNNQYIFLPAAGNYHYDDSFTGSQPQCQNKGVQGSFWTSACYDESSYKWAAALLINDKTTNPYGGTYDVGATQRFWGMSVRAVCP